MAQAKVKGLLDSLQKTFGSERVMMASDIVVGPPVSTGSLALDFATQYGGFPSNRVVELYGREGTGKTTLALQVMLSALKMHPQRGALFLDVEHKLDLEWLKMLVGEEIVNERLIYIKPNSIENATNIYRQAVESGQVCCTILDSVGGAPTVRRNDDAEVGHYGGNAIGVGEFARSAATWSSIYDCLTIGINQVRAPVNKMSFSDDTPGGKAWRHACTLRIELVRGKDTHQIRMPGEEKPVPVGYTIYGKVRKNQVGPEGRTAMYWFHNTWTPEYGFGIDTVDEVSRLSLKTGVVEQRGGWYHHPELPVDGKGEHKVQGLPKLLAEVRENEGFREVLSAEVLGRLKDHAADVAPMSDPEAPVEETSGLMKLYLEGENA